MHLPQLSEKFFNTLLTFPAPYPVKILKKEPWYSFTKHNGYIPFAQKLVMQVHSNLGETEEIWNEFSPNKSLFDLWEIRRAFFESYKIDPYFLTIYQQTGTEKNIMGVLPMWLDNDEYAGKYAWCGGFWPEDNTFFVKDTEVIPLLLMAAPSPVFLQCILPNSDYDFLKTLHGYTEEKSKKYFLDLTRYGTLSDYLSVLKKKKRYNIKRDRKRILSLKPKTIINDFTHLDRLFELNVLRFRQKPVEDQNATSLFEDDRQRELFRKLISNADVYHPRMISTVINGNVEAVELGFIYKKTYYAMCAGVDIMKYSGMGVYSNLLVMEDALNHGCEKIDFLEGNYNWKDSWRLNSFTPYEFIK